MSNTLAERSLMMGWAMFAIGSVLSIVGISLKNPVLDAIGFFFIITAIVFAVATAVMSIA